MLCVGASKGSLVGRMVDGEHAGYPVDENEETEEFRGRSSPVISNCVLLVHFGREFKSKPNNADIVARHE